MSATSIISSKCLYILHWLYVRCFYHSGRALVPIPHEQVRLPPEKAKNPALKPGNKRKLGYKKDKGHLNYVYQMFVHIILII